MPLLQTPNSSIGSVYFTSDGTNSGQRVWVDWPNWSRLKKVKSTVFGCGSGTPYVSTFGLGAKGTIELRIPSCPHALYAALRTLADTATHYTATLYHPQLGTKSLTVEVLAVASERNEDDQWDATDPAKDILVTAMSYGTAP